MRLPNRKPGKYTFPTFDPHMTQEKYDAMKAKMEYLKKTARPKAIKEAQKHAENGDFSENAEYQIARGRLRGMNRTIDEIAFQLPRAIIIDASEDSAVVQIGHTVTVSTPDEQSVTWKILGPSESDPAGGIVSHLSPIGAALLGKTVGETATVELPEQNIVYTVEAIEVTTT